MESKRIRGYIFLVLEMLRCQNNEEVVKVEQVSIVLYDKYVISFQERHGDILNALRDRIRNSKSIVRKMSSDYLGHSIINAIVDGYFVILEKIGDRTTTSKIRWLKNPTWRPFRKCTIGRDRW